MSSTKTSQVETVATVTMFDDEDNTSIVDEVSFRAKNTKRPSPGKRQRIRNKFQASTLKNNALDSFFDGRYLGLAEKTQTKFWTSPILLLEYAIVLIAMISKRYWLLQGTLLVASAFIAYIIYKWICFIIDDPKMKKCVVSFRWYLGFACRQAEATFKGGNARRMVEGGVLAWRGTAEAFLKWFFRQRSANVNRVMVQQHQTNMERLKQWQVGIKNSLKS